MEEGWISYYRKVLYCIFALDMLLMWETKLPFHLYNFFLLSFAQLVEIAVPDTPQRLHLYVYESQCQYYNVDRYTVCPARTTAACTAAGIQADQPPSEVTQGDRIDQPVTRLLVYGYIYTGITVKKDLKPRPTRVAFVVGPFLSRARLDPELRLPKLKLALLARYIHRMSIEID
eukprot:1393962-Amorphochlora_amoeboformis.AAC.1